MHNNKRTKIALIRYNTDDTIVNGRVTINQATSPLPNKTKDSSKIKNATAHVINLFLSLFIFSLDDLHFADRIQILVLLF